MTFLSRLSLGIVGLGVAAIVAFVYGEIRYNQGRTDAIVAEAQLEVKIQRGSLQISQEALTVYRPQLVEVQSTSSALLSEVPTHVTPQNDSACLVPRSFVSLWNDANQMQLPGSSAGVTGESSPVVLSDIAAQHVREATVCTETEKQRDALKVWLEAQTRLYEKTKSPE